MLERQHPVSDFVLWCCSICWIADVGNHPRKRIWNLCVCVCVWRWSEIAWDWKESKCTKFKQSLSWEIMGERERHTHRARETNHELLAGTLNHQLWVSSESNAKFWNQWLILWSSRADLKAASAAASSFRCNYHHLILLLPPILLWLQERKAWKKSLS